MTSRPLGAAEEVGDVGGEVLGGEFVDEHVAVAAPGVGGGGGEDGEERGGEGDAGDKGEAHGVSIAGGVGAAAFDVLTTA